MKTMFAGTSPCARDEWLSSLLHRSVYRLEAPAAALEHRDASASLESCMHQSPAFIYAKISCRDIPASAWLSDRGFYCVETSLVFEKQVLPAPAGQEAQETHTVRFAVPDDEGRVRKLARNSFVYSRFHSDHRFSKKEADTVKEAWAGNFFHGKRGTHMVVAEIGHACAGFLQIMAQQGTLVIDLFAVDAAHRGRGIAGDMIAFAERSIPDLLRIRVGTQAANIPSVRLYERCGFRLTGSGYVFHYHH